MNVVLPLVSAAQHISGVQRHAINAAASLLKSSQITRVHLIAGAWQRYVPNALPTALLSDPRLEIEFVAFANTIVRRNLWFYSQLPGLCSARKADIVHLAYPVPLRRTEFRARVVVTLHDLYPYDLPENFGFPKVFFNRSILRQCLRAADAIACVSDSTLQRLERLEPLAALAKAVIIYNAVERSTAVPLIPATLTHHDHFLLCIAQHRRNKNILLLLQSYVLLLRAKELPQGTRLLIVGIGGPESPTIHRFIREHNLNDEVVLVAGLSEGELQWCYQHCSALVAPSSIEGFGLPIAEGALAGCRIICSDIPAHREVGSDTCDYVPLTQSAVSGFAEAIVRKLALPRPLPAELPHLSTRSVGNQYLRLYRSLCGGRHPARGTHRIAAVRPKEKELEA